MSDTTYAFGDFIDVLAYPEVGWERGIFIRKKDGLNLIGVQYGANVLVSDENIRPYSKDVVQICPKPSGM